MGRTSLAATALAAMLFGSVAAEAAPIRPGITSAIQSATITGKIRASQPTRRDQHLLGAPLFLVFLGAVAITVGTIVIVNNNDNGGSH